MSFQRRFLYAVLIVLFCLGLYVFYPKYVPLIRPFQLILLPVLFVTLILTSVDARRGSLFFVFAFPLVNVLPYLYGVYEHTPHAPTALVLFLFFFLGWLMHNLLLPQNRPPGYPVFKPLLIFSLIISVSAVITFFRFANFWPFRTDGLYELSTNVHGVTAGGAIMSTLFSSLNYLSGFAFFLILSRSVKSTEYVKKILLIFLLSTAFVLLVGSYQHFRDITFANTPMRAEEGLVNATLKDPMSCGAYLSALIPILLAGVFAWKGALKALSLVMFFAALFLLPQTGSKSGLVSTGLSLAVFLGLFLSGRMSSKTPRLGRILKPMGTALLILLLIGTAWMMTRESEAFRRLTGFNKKTGGLGETLRMRSNLWTMAVHMMTDYPLTGVGIGAYIIELPNYVKTHGGAYPQWTDSAEDYFLHAGAEMGILVMILVLWIFWEILRQMRRALGSSTSLTQMKFFRLGISCGLISLLSTFVVHTFIGSYEIKYTFWFLAALVFYPSQRLEDEKRGGTTKPWTSGIILFLFIFTGFHLWNSTHALSLARRTERLGLEQNFGLYKEETTQEGRNFRWTKSYGGIAVRMTDPVIQVALHASHPDINKRPVRVKVYLVEDLFKSQELLDEVVLADTRWQTLEYSLPDRVSRQFILFFKVSRTWNPRREKGIPDPRNLGVAVGEIRFLRKHAD